MPILYSLEPKNLNSSPNGYFRNLAQQKWIIEGPREGESGCKQAAFGEDVRRTGISIQGKKFTPTSEELETFIGKHIQEPTLLAQINRHYNQDAAAVFHHLANMALKHDGLKPDETQYTFMFKREEQKPRNIDLQMSKAGTLLKIEISRIDYQIMPPTGEAAYETLPGKVVFESVLTDAGFKLANIQFSNSILYSLTQHQNNFYITPELIRYAQLEESLQNVATRQHTESLQEAIQSQMRLLFRCIPDELSTKQAAEVLEEMRKFLLHHPDHEKGIAYLDRLRAIISPEVSNTYNHLISGAQATGAVLLFAGAVGAKTLVPNRNLGTAMAGLATLGGGALTASAISRHGRYSFFETEAKAKARPKLTAFLDAIDTYIGTYSTSPSKATL